jgi:hypothetical protein
MLPIRVHRPIYCTHLPTNFLHTGNGWGIDSFTRVDPRVCSECGAIEGTEEYAWLATHPTMRAVDPPTALMGGGNSENSAGN